MRSGESDPKQQAAPLARSRRYTQISLRCSGLLIEGKKAVLDETMLEQRLVTLEAAVSDLQHKLEEKPTSQNWLEKLMAQFLMRQLFVKP